MPRAAALMMPSADERAPPSAPPRGRCRRRAPPADADAERRRLCRHTSAAEPFISRHYAELVVHATPPRATPYLPRRFTPTIIYATRRKHTHYLPPELSLRRHERRGRDEPMMTPRRRRCRRRRRHAPPTPPPPMRRRRRDTPMSCRRAAAETSADADAPPMPMPREMTPPPPMMPMFI